MSEHERKEREDALLSAIRELTVVVRAAHEYLILRDNPLVLVPPAPDKLGQAVEFHNPGHAPPVVVPVDDDAGRDVQS